MRNLGMAEPRASNNIIRNWFISVSWYQYLAFSLRVSPTVARWLPVHVLFFTSLSERVCFFPKRRSRIPGFLVIVLSLGQVTWFTIWATREAPRRLLVSPQNDWWLRLQRICRLQCRRLGFDPWVGKIPWRRERLPTPIFLLGELHGQRSLAGYSSWGLKEWDMTERLTHIQNLCSFMRNTISSAKCFISFLHLSCGNPNFFQATQSWGSCLTSCAS